MAKVVHRTEVLRLYAARVRFDSVQEANINVLHTRRGKLASSTLPRLMHNLLTNFQPYRKLFRCGTVWDQ